MQYCNKSLIKNNNEILQYFNKNNDIALVMHQRALLDMSDMDGSDQIQDQLGCILYIIYLELLYNLFLLNLIYGKILYMEYMGCVSNHQPKWTNQFVCFDF